MTAAKIGICMPLYNNLPAISFTSFINCLSRKRDHQIQMFFAEGTDICTARNKLVDMFLQSDCNYLLFLDSDIVIPPNIIERLLEKNKDVVSALYFTRGRAIPMMREQKGSTYIEMINFPRNSTFEVNGGVGLGCILIKREVIEKISKQLGKKPFFKFEYPANDVTIGEDIYFCDLTRKAGYKIFVDSSTPVGHFGGVIDEGYSELMKLKEKYVKEKAASLK